MRNSDIFLIKQNSEQVLEYGQINEQGTIENDTIQDVTISSNDLPRINCRDYLLSSEKLLDHSPRNGNELNKHEMPSQVNINERMRLDCQGVRIVEEKQFKDSEQRSMISFEDQLFESCLIQQNMG